MRMAESFGARTVRPRSRPGRCAVRMGRICGVSLAAMLALGASACLLPVRSAPRVAGSVVDERDGEPVEGALVVLRYDGSYSDQLPDREHLGHAESVTGRDGRFELARYTRDGLTFWPLFDIEARVVAVFREGYRCATPLLVQGDHEVRIQLAPARDAEDQRQSCRPVASRRGETRAYRTAWQQLFPAPETAADREKKRQVTRLLDARAALGFGDNCEGPVSDLSLAPGGQRVAFIAAEQESWQVQLLELGDERPEAPKVVAELAEGRGRRLAWNGAGELLLFRPASRARRVLSASVFAA